MLQKASREQKKSFFQAISFQSSSNGIEGRISFLFLFMLLVIAAVIGLQQNHYDLAKYGVSKGQSESSAKGSLLADFPFAALTPPGYKTLLKPEKYNQDSLYEKINGKAPLYTEAGFQGLVTQRFVRKQNANDWIEIFLYDMGNIHQAFAVFSQQRRAGSTALKAKGYAYTTPNAVYIVMGQIYIEILGSNNSQYVQSAIQSIYQYLDSKIAQVNKILELALFDPKYLVVGSEVLYLKNVFGFSGLQSVFVGKMKIDGKTVTVFLSPKKDAKTAQNEANRFTSFLIKDGGKRLSAKEAIADLYLIDYLGSVEAVFVHGKTLVGVHEANDPAVAVKASKILYSYLTNKL